MFAASAQLMEIGPKELKEFYALDDATKEMLKMAMTELNFSVRA